MSGKTCVCEGDAVRDPVSLTCVTKCPAGQFEQQGACGSCSLGTVYNTVLKQCLCPEGSYQNANGACEVRVKPLVCTGATYAASETSCEACHSSCETCSGPATCLTCKDPNNLLVFGKCVSATCGNGNYDEGEACDDSNPNSGDGCSETCNIETGYNCAGYPSICSKASASLCGNGELNSGEACDDRNSFSGDGCSS